MPRFRTTQFNNPQYTSSEYTNKIKNIERLKFARSIQNCKKYTDEFIIGCMLKKEPVEISNNKITCCTNKLENTDIKYIDQPAFYIAIFENYTTMIDLLLQQAYLDKECSKCSDVPMTLHNGLTSEFCFDDYFKSVTRLSKHPCKCLPIRDINICQLESQKLYPYGHFNNNNPNINKGLRRRLVLNCSKQELCPTYVYCKCPPDEINCKCCDYTVTFPFKDTFISYVVSGCQDKELYNLMNNPGRNPNKNFDNYLEHLQANKQFQHKAINSFTRNYII